MENDLENHLCEELLSILHGYGIDASPQQVKLLVGHLLCVIERNRVVNLTRIVNAEDALFFIYWIPFFPFAAMSLKKHPHVVCRHWDRSRISRHSHWNYDGVPGPAY